MREFSKEERRGIIIICIVVAAILGYVLPTVILGGLETLKNDKIDEGYNLCVSDLQTGIIESLEAYGYLQIQSGENVITLVPYEEPIIDIDSNSILNE